MPTEFADIVKWPNSLSTNNYTNKVALKRKKNGKLHLIALVAGFLLLHFGSKSVLSSPESDPLVEKNDSIASKSSTISPLQLCISAKCMQDTGASLARAFPDRTDQKWLVVDNGSSRNSHNEGVMLVKTPKAASTTSSGIAIRIARRNEKNNANMTVSYAHQLGLNFRNRDPSKSFLFTPVRDPAKRAMSFLFYKEVTHKRTIPLRRNTTDALMIQHLNPWENFNFRSHDVHTHGKGGFSLQYATLRDIPAGSAWSYENKSTVINASRVEENVHHLVNSYDFLLVVERMQESLVAMALIMGLDVGNVLTTSSKVAGQNYALLPVRKACIKLEKSYVPTAVEAYLDSDTWHAMNYGDYLLHAAANASLDLTIESLGKERFVKALREYRRLGKLAETMCAPNVEFPCSDLGIYQPSKAAANCYIKDFGCGYQCLDKIEMMPRAKVEN